MSDRMISHVNKMSRIVIPSTKMTFYRDDFANDKQYVFDGILEKFELSRMANEIEITILDVNELE